MPRKPRIEYDGAVYHVMCRGNRREAIFRNGRDSEMFPDTLGESIGRCGWRVHAYVLMGNHYHMLLDPYAVGKGRTCVVPRTQKVITVVAEDSKGNRGKKDVAVGK